MIDERKALEARINALLPPRYVGCFEDVAPSSMGSAQLRYDDQGRVVWGEIWTTFCHLALAGGPPHRGRLLDAVADDELHSSPAESAGVTAELERCARPLRRSADRRRTATGLDRIAMRIAGRRGVVGAGDRRRERYGPTRKRRAVRPGRTALPRREGN
ncbi:MAG: hypothetical protein QM811_08345 [Pirellulales bacterium]